ncbi:MAG: alpha/beta hydrolase [Oleispira sp.]|nr:alpha/beta hydrolase [Oleispira sp.]MBL4879917.1 alpha/beta hydrolase [Oleispira sp.]
MLNYYRNLPAEMLKKEVTPIIQVPTLMLWGENDPYTSKDTTQGTDKYVKNLELKFLPNCSHWTQQDCPEEVNRLMNDFLEFIA